tara:strand:- start:441 stop:2006 length:1566 start_codon:yes stop_codon:yes gene_type:complete
MEKITYQSHAILIAALFLLFSATAHAQILYQLPAYTPTEVREAYSANVEEYQSIQDDLERNQGSYSQYEINQKQGRMAALKDENSSIQSIVSKYTDEDAQEADLSGSQLGAYNTMRKDYILSSYRALDLSNPDRYQDERIASDAEDGIGTVLYKEDKDNSGIDFDSIESAADNRSTEEISQDEIDSSIALTFIQNLQYHTFDFVSEKIYEDLAAQTNTLFIFFVSVWLLYVITAFFILQNQLSPQQILFQLFLILIASTILTSGGKELFINYFYSPLLSSFYGLADFFIAKATSTGGGAGGTDFAGALKRIEDLFSAVRDTSNYMIDNTSTWSWTKKIKIFAFSWVFTVSAAALLFLFTAYWAYSLFALHVLLAFTPLFVALACFKMTRQYTFKWFSGIINYLTIPVVLSVSMGITISVIGEYVDFTGDVADNLIENDNVNGGAQSTLFSVFLITILSFLVHLRVGEIAAFLTGGVSSGLSSSWSLGIMAAQTSWSKSWGAGKWGGGKAVGAVKQKLSGNE